MNEQKHKFLILGCARTGKSTLLQRLHGVEVDPDVPYVRSSGVIEEHLELSSGTGIGQFLCVGGSRGERRKWIHVFSDTDVVIFVVALPDFNAYLFEDASQNAMTESLMLWTQLVQSTWFQDSKRVVIFTKWFEFERDLVTSSVADVADFSSYDASADEITSAAESALNFFVGLFTEAANHQCTCFVTDLIFRSTPYFHWGKLRGETALAAARSGYMTWAMGVINTLPALCRRRVYDFLLVTSARPGSWVNSNDLLSKLSSFTSTSK